MNETVRKDTREQVTSSLPSPFCHVRIQLKMCVCVCVHVCTHVLSCVQLFATSWTAICQAPQSTGFSRQKYWSGLPFPSPGDLPNPGTEPESPALGGGFFTTVPPGKNGHL